MSSLVPITLLGWTPIVLLMFMAMPPRRAVIFAFIAAWLFLPVPVPEALMIQGLPELDKMTVTCIAVLLGTALFDKNRLLSFRLKRFDIPIIIWCIVPLFSSLTNTDITIFEQPAIANPIYDGLSEVLKQTVTWGLPYLIGRVYFNDLAALRELAVGIFIGGLIYIPLCLFELKMSPQLHFLAYGQHPHADFRQAMRSGGYRPTVFMAHGLMVALWMASATLIGAWLWLSGTLKHLAGIPLALLVVPLFLVTLASKSMASVLLMSAGLTALYVATRTPSRWPIIALIAVAPVYMSVRATGIWDGNNLVSLITTVAGEDRAESLQTRFTNEDLLTQRAFEKPLFGWAGWGRSRVYDRHGKDISITDGQWVIALGKNGMVGLIAFTATLLMPVWLTLKRFPIRHWAHPKAAPAAALAAVLLVYMIDNLLNAMINPVFMLAAGALAGQGVNTLQSKARRPARTNQPQKSRSTITTNTRAAALDNH
jgi:hypothetical protein